MEDIKKLRTYREYLIDKLKNSAYAQEYLSAALEEYSQDKDLEALLLALHSLAIAQGGLSLLARKSEMNRQNLHKVLSGKRSPKWETMEAILHALGYKFCIQPLEHLSKK